jgi:hypothetical protein
MPSLVRPAGAAPSRPRPPVLRALGADDPPLAVTVGGRSYARYELLKHDSWAATAIYAGPAGKIVCKFNRTQPVYGIRMDWLGRRLAARERRALERLADLPNVPNSLGDVIVNGRVLPNAVARVYVPGHPLRPHERVRADFFPTLRTLLAEMHRRGIAYVDLHKRENVIVGDDGRPYLIDFQIGFDATHTRVAWLPGVRYLFDVLCQSDLYHLRKHVAHHAPELNLGLDRPWWITAHRAVAVPFRQLRRRLLVAAGVRTGAGHVETEQFAEDAVRNAPARRAA